MQTLQGSAKLTFIVANHLSECRISQFNGGTYLPTFEHTIIQNMETQNDKQQISNLIGNWAKALTANDMPGILANHSPDIVMFDVVEPFQSKGIAAYQKSWENEFFPWHSDDGFFEVDELEITVEAHVAFCHAVYHCGGSGSGRKESFNIRLTAGLIKTAGQWTITHEHHSDVAK